MLYKGLAGSCLLLLGVRHRLGNLGQGVPHLGGGNAGRRVLESLYMALISILSASFASHPGTVLPLVLLWQR